MNLLTAFRIIVLATTLTISSIMSLRVIRLTTPSDKKLYQVVKTNFGKWRRCRGDVFRKPVNSLIFSLLIGSGL